MKPVKLVRMQCHIFGDQGLEPLQQQEQSLITLTCDWMGDCSTLHGS